MRYFVMLDESDASAKVAAPNERPKAYEFDDAIAHAYRLLDDGKHNVAIRDEAGNSISGDDLIACYNGEKQPTADLKAVPVSD
jgi:hypothetical protein